VRSPLDITNKRFSGNKNVVRLDEPRPYRDPPVEHEMDEIRIFLEDVEDTVDCFHQLPAEILEG
jgi:cell division septum initiation protein DivIVA